MSDYVYDEALTEFATGGINWLTDDIKAVACSSAYSASQTGDHYLSSIAAGARKATSGNMSGKTVSKGVCDCDDFNLSITAADVITQVVWYKDTGNEATSPVICRYDSFAGLPYTGNGGLLNVRIPNDAKKLFKL